MRKFLYQILETLHTPIFNPVREAFRDGLSAQERHIQENHLWKEVIMLSSMEINKTAMKGFQGVEGGSPWGCVS